MLVFSLSFVFPLSNKQNPTVIHKPFEMVFSTIVYYESLKRDLKTKVFSYPWHSVVFLCSLFRDLFLDVDPFRSVPGVSHVCRMCVGSLFIHCIIVFGFWSLFYFRFHWNISRYSSVSQTPVSYPIILFDLMKKNTWIPYWLLSICCSTQI